MRIAVDFGDGRKREVEVHHTTVVENGKLKEVYRSSMITDPVTGKPCYVEFDPATGEVKVYILEKTPKGWKTVEVRKVA